MAKAVATGERSRPKTVLGFYWGVIATILAGTVAAVTALSRQDSTDGLVLPVLIFGGLTSLLILVFVFYLNVKAPPKLMLGEITGRDYITYERMTLGDSVTGEQLETASYPLAVEQAEPLMMSLPSSSSDAGETEEE
jgi:hypothetical protein